MSFPWNLFAVVLLFAAGTVFGAVILPNFLDSKPAGRHRHRHPRRRPEPEPQAKPAREPRSKGIRVRGFIGHPERPEPVVVGVDMDAVERALAAGDNGETAVLPTVEPDATVLPIPVSPAPMEAAA